MKNAQKILWLSMLLSIIVSCSITKDYKKAVSINTTAVYEKYLKDFPKSKYKDDVNTRLQRLYDVRDWNKAVSNNSVYYFIDYLNNHPNGEFVMDAKNKIEKIEKQNELDDAWYKARLDHTIESYQYFVNLYPNSSYTHLAMSFISKLKEENSWMLAKTLNTISSYSAYLKDYTYGKYSTIANYEIEVLKEEKYILPIWKDVIKENTYQMYLDFKNKYPNSSYAVIAKERMTKIESKDWDKAFKNNTVKSFEDCIKKYPFSEYVEIAEKRIIDLEVDEIFRGDYGHLPPMEKKSSNKYSSKTLTNSIEIFNNTQFSLTVRYSGDESKKVVLHPKQRIELILKNGEYRIAASVNSSNITDYAGEQKLTGGGYSSEYYIQRIKY